LPVSPHPFEYPPAFPQRQLQFHSAKFSFGPANKSASVEKAKQRQKKKRQKEELEELESGEPRKEKK